MEGFESLPTPLLLLLLVRGPFLIDAGPSRERTKLEEEEYEEGKGRRRWERRGRGGGKRGMTYPIGIENTQKGKL